MRAPRIVSGAAALFALVLFSAGLDAQFGRTAPPGLTVWADANYRGANHTFQEDTPDISATGLGRQISSLRPGTGESWEVCSEPNYGGRCRVFSGAASNLRDVSWNDVIMSVRRVREPARGEAPPPPPGRGPVPTLPPARGLELYAGTQYAGQRLVLTEALPDFRKREFSDRAMSLRVPPKETWEVCVNVNYDECHLVSEDIPDLAAHGLARVISSARPRQAGLERRFGLPGARARLVLYDGANFTGRSLTIDSDQATLRFFNNDAGSVLVQGGRWQLCDRPNYGGNCVEITDSIRDLRRIGLRDRVSSVRRR